MNNETISQINTIIDEKEIDDRVKPLVKLYFLGKANKLTIEQIKSQIDILCSRIPNIEFTSNNIVAGYSNKSGVLTINKQLFLEKKSDEIILPVFMKFESALNQNNRRNYSNYIEDFIRAGRISKAISAPISDRLYKLYEMAEYIYGDIEYKVDELINDGAWKITCSEYNEALNKMIITGKDNPDELFNAAGLFHYEILTEEALKNPLFKGPYQNEKYQKKAALIISCIDNNFNNQRNNLEKEDFINNIKLFTGCTDEMIEEQKITTYAGNPKISAFMESTIKANPQKISEEYIVSKVQNVLDKKTNWDSRIKHLVIPFFIRSQKIYNWDIDEFQERLNELDLKIDKISFNDFGNITTAGNTAIDEIRLNSRIFLDKKRKNYISSY